jgi:hypothetical protein
MNLTDYQRGNRDGLLSLAKWADEQAKIYQLEYEKISKKIEDNDLSSTRFESLAKNNLYFSQLYLTVANQARRLSEALPLDPEV